MEKMDKFYEDYWLYREKVGRIHTKDGMWVPERLSIASSMINKNDKKKIFCIDIGCGEGTMGKILREKFGSDLYIVGCDISENAIKLARLYYNKTFVLNIENDNIKEVIDNMKFDYIVSLEVLEHLMFPEKVLEKFKAIIKEDGNLIASFPNIVWWQYRLEVLGGHFPKGYTYYHSSEHIQNFTLYSFREMLNNSGFQIVELDGQFPCPRFLRPGRIFNKFIKKFPNLFGYQIVVKASLKK